MYLFWAGAYIPLTKTSPIDLVNEALNHLPGDRRMNFKSLKEGNWVFICDENNEKMTFNFSMF